MKSSSRGRPSLSTLFQLLFAGALLYWLVSSGNIRLEDITGLFGGTGRNALLGACVLLLLTLVLGSWRLQVYFRHVGLDLGLWAFVKLNYVGLLMAQCLPGLTAGDVVRGYFLAHHMKENPLPGIVTMVWDRIIGLCGLLCLGAIPTVGLLVSVHGLEHTWPLLLTLAVLAVGLLWIARDPEKISKIVRTLEIWFPLPASLKGKESQTRAMLKSLITDFQLNVWGLAVSCLLHALNVTALILLARHLGDRTPVLMQFILIPIVILGGVVPATPGNVGWNEWISKVAWNRLGASPIGASVFVSYRLVNLLISLPALVWVIRSPMHRARPVQLSGKVPAAEGDPDRAVAEL